MLKLLRALFDPQLPVPQSDAFYRHVLDDSQSLLISSQLCFLLKVRHRLDETPLFFQNELKIRSMRNMMISAVIAKEMERLLDLFESLGIHVIPFKGPLFAEKYFGSLNARSTSDLDILVKPQQMDAAATALGSLGFSSGIQYEPEHFHKVFHKVLPKYNFDLYVEVHWHILRKGTSSLNMDALWKDSVPRNQASFVRELSDLHMFFLICLHGWNHEFNNWKYFIDIIQMIHSLDGKLDYKDLLVFAKCQKTYRRIVHSLIIVYREFPHLNVTLPLPLRTGKRTWWDKSILGTDNDPEATWPTLVRRMKQLDDYDTWQQKWTFFRREILPDPITMSRTMHSCDERYPRMIQYILLYAHRFSGLFSSDSTHLKKGRAEREK
ncbi:nucleotidyltransferase family protein [Sporolactobacillus pectinivorans]|uniref:nucleotidyltransferase family protein n=1 Tax=Sporolactobacillus pectinivorans TaxID=1591408 RepID=UPI000C25DDF1|nr:nucleotidyltransferase family protein [Sporolactobacillus pectinivorans]